MITYTARTWKGSHITVVCSTRDQALDLAEGDLHNGITPITLELYGIRLNERVIRRLLAWRRARSREVGV